MKDSIITITRPGRVAMFLGCSMLALAAGCSAPIWYIDAGFGERLAKQENKPLLFYFKACDSTQHRNMKMKVFSDPKVKKELLKTVNVELEFSWSDPYKTRYGVSNPQVCVICDPQGKKVSHALYVNPVPSVPHFLEWLRTAYKEAAPPPPSTQDAKRDKK